MKEEPRTIFRSLEWQMIPSMKKRNKEKWIEEILKHHAKHIELLFPLDWICQGL